MHLRVVILKWNLFSYIYVGLVTLNSHKALIGLQLYMVSVLARLCTQCNFPDFQVIDISLCQAVFKRYFDGCGSNMVLYFLHNVTRFAKNDHITRK